MKMARPWCFATVSLAGCGAEPLCSSDVTHVARDIGSDRYAVTATRDCGATTDYATIVRIGRASELQSAASEVFVADSNHGAAAERPGGAIWVKVVWTAPGQLSVAYDSRARVFKRVLDAKGASIRYKTGVPYSRP
ncbi:hypothetical protein C8J39_2741 [Sphingomonas sp. PP-CC-1A-547]|jgi:hypothetical protein|nr:hypothetical protein C8J39_2741 [Sphingomonas sp. PP-CC-1A-547]